jgi:hypothetical protein
MAFSTAKRRATRFTVLGKSATNGNEMGTQRVLYGLMEDLIVTCYISSPWRNSEE